MSIGILVTHLSELAWTLLVGNIICVSYVMLQRFCISEVYEISLGEYEYNAATYYLVPHIYAVIGMHDHQRMEKQ